MIPKKIYSTWISDKPVPQKFEKYIESWKRVMPDYEVHIISMENVKHGTFVDKAIAIKNYALAGHYARVQELYENGGIYFDIDVEAVKSFDCLLHNKLVLGAESKTWINNAVIVAEKGHPYLKECLDYMDAFPFDSEKIELATGPIMFTNIMKKRGWKVGEFDKIYKDVAILRPEYFYPYHYDEFYTPECVTENTLSVHHWGNSWNNKVTVVIPCYKQAHFLPDAIESVLNQTYQDIEIIVVNDGSPDNTSEVVKQYMDGIPLARNRKAISNNGKVKLIEKENGGLSSARNAGIKKAAGGWILPLDADDKIHPQFIERTIGKNDIVATGLVTFGDQSKRWVKPFTNPTLENFLHKNPLNCCSLFKKDVWTMAGGYDENMKLGYEDWEFWIRAAKCGFNFTCLTDEFLFYYRKHSVSMLRDAMAKHNEIIAYMSRKHPLNSFKKK
jgi:mannosyltransferase OCH1-like enzyme